MAYICEYCGELAEDGKKCICRKEAAREALKKRKKRYILRERTEKDLADHILKSRNIGESLEEFSSIPFQRLYEERFLNQEEAEKKIIRALDQKKKIAIYGDYDADGITGTAVGVNILRGLGGDVIPYINDRFDEGFGIHPKGVEALAWEKASLIITVDNGIAGIEGVEKARELGIEVLVTDHHEPNSTLPDCLIVDPKQPGCPYSNKEITGVGVLFKILLQVCRHYGKEALAKKEMDLVALGTVADMAPLLGENRTLVKAGLLIWNHEKGKYGIKQLLKELGINREVTAYELGFLIAPAFNAESRLKGKPLHGLNVLTSRKKEEMEEGAKELVALNEKRKAMLEEQLTLGDQLIEEDKELFFIYHERIAEGIAGLIASRLLETYGRPVIVLGRTKEGIYKGSGRSIPGFDLKKALDKNAPLLLKYGGHKQACGLSVSQENLQAVKSFLETEGKMVLGGKERIEEISLDGELFAEDLQPEAIERMMALEPYGIGFQKPQFLLRGVIPGEVSLMKELHSKFSWGNADILAFNRQVEEGKALDITGIPGINEYRGKRRVQFIVKDIIEEDGELCGYGTSQE